MDERSSKRKKQDHDFSVTAFRVVEEATDNDTPVTEETPLDTEGKNPNAVALGRLGGKKGGKARAEKLTPERRKEIAQKTPYSYPLEAFLKPPGPASPPSRPAPCNTGNPGPTAPECFAVRRKYLDPSLIALPR